mmetsp:Transcript_4100/g.9574  ORF Transcript_4100/g.9574 Transcript_4100/m.9574 type:complete len:237 (-) Transcript_4100:448-1158(-)
MSMYSLSSSLACLVSGNGRYSLLLYSSSPPNEDMTIWHVTTTFSDPFSNHLGSNHLGGSSGSPSPYSSIRSLRTVPSGHSSASPAAMSLTAFPPSFFRSLPVLWWTCRSIKDASLLSGLCFKRTSRSASHFSQSEKAKKAWARLYKAFSFVGCLSRILSVRSLTLPQSPRLMCSCARLFLNVHSKAMASSGSEPNARIIPIPASQSCCACARSPALKASLPDFFKVDSTRPTQKAS